MIKQFGNKSVIGLALIAALALPAVPTFGQTGDGEQATSIFYVVRHAERQCKKKDGDPPLNAHGQTRAQALAELLKDKNIKYIHAPNKLRATQTAQPLADLLQIDVNKYAKKKPCELSSRIKKMPGNHLVVGLANDVPTIVSQLGYEGEGYCKILPRMPGTDFDQLFIVTVPDDEDALQTNYGEPSNLCN